MVLPSDKNPLSDPEAQKQFIFGPPTPEDVPVEARAKERILEGKEADDDDPLDPASLNYDPKLFLPKIHRPPPGVEELQGKDTIQRYVPPEA